MLAMFLAAIAAWSLVIGAPAAAAVWLALAGATVVYRLATDHGPDA